MFGNRAHLNQTRKYITAFATLFNDIAINPFVPSHLNQPSKEQVVPIAFGPKEKWLTILNQDPEKRSQAITLPRMSFDIASFSYEPEKTMQQSITRHIIGNKHLHSPANYRIDITLSIMAKYHEDIFAIIEQIIPYFRPSISVKIKSIGDDERSHTMAVDLTSVSPEVDYEGSFDDGRVLIYTLTFTITVPYFIGNSSNGNEKLIKKATAYFHNIDNPEPHSSISVYPGIDADGNPTNDPAEAIPYSEVELGQEHGIVVEIEELRL